MCSESPEPLAGRLGAPAAAKASRISRRAVKSRCAREWDGWGRLSDDGPGQNNPVPSEGPWGGGSHQAIRSSRARSKLSATESTMSVHAFLDEIRALPGWRRDGNGATFAN